MNPEELEELCLEKAGFCGCGAPEDALKLLKEVLGLLAVRSDYSSDREQIWKDSFRKMEERLHFKEEDRGLYYTYLYYLDARGFTEHGGGVQGCWLTSEGHEMLDLLKQLYPDEA